MAFLRRLSVLALLFAFALSARAQVNVRDGSQNPVVLSQTASVGTYVFHSKYIPSHIIFAFEPLAAMASAFNPGIKCTLDDQSLNPNTDTSKWMNVAYTSVQGQGFDITAPSVGQGGSTNTWVIETGVMPCVSWSINPNPPSGVLNNMKIMAVQLPASGDAAWLFAITQGDGAAIEGGAVRVNTQSPCSGGGCPPGGVSSGVVPTQSKVAIAGISDNATGLAGILDTAGNGDLLGINPFYIYNITGGGVRQFVRARLCQNNATPIVALGAATAQLIATPTAPAIFNRVCLFIFSNTSVTATTVSVVHGTSTNCSIGTTTLIPPMVLAANSNLILPIPDNGSFTSAVTDEICITSSAAGSTNVYALYEDD